MKAFAWLPVYAFCCCLVVTETFAQEAFLSTTRVRFGSTYNSDPKNVDVLVGGGTFEVIGTIPAWLTVVPTTGNAPGRIQFFADVSKVPAAGDSALLQVLTPRGPVTLPILATCSTSSGCGGAPVDRPTITTTTTTTLPGTPVTVTTSTTTTTIPLPPPVPGLRTCPANVPVPSALAEVRSDPIRPTYCEISIKLDSQAPYMFYRGRITTETQRDAMEETRTAIALPEAIRYARTIPGCESAVNEAILRNQGLSHIVADLGPVYEMDSLGQGHGGEWDTDKDGRHYNIEHYMLRGIQKCSVNKKQAAACASSPLMRPDLLDLLDMRIEKGRCVNKGPHYRADGSCVKNAKGACAKFGGALFNFMQPTELKNDARWVSGRVKVVPGHPIQLSADQKALIDRVHLFHMQSANLGCGSTTPGGAVQDAHMAVEASARNEDEAHFLRMKDFSGATDPRWSQKALCNIKILEDQAHMEWAEHVKAGQWGFARLVDNDHQAFHICRGLKDSRLLIRPSCGLEIGKCPLKTCAQYLEEKFPGNAQ